MLPLAGEEWEPQVPCTTDEPFPQPPFPNSQPLHQPLPQTLRISLSKSSSVSMTVTTQTKTPRSNLIHWILIHIRLFFFLFFYSLTLPQLLKPFQCAFYNSRSNFSKISSKLKFSSKPCIFFNVPRKAFIPTEDTDFLVALSNGSCFSPMVSVPLGTRIGRVFSYYSLQSQILDFIYPTMFYGLLHQPQVYTL